LFRVVAERLEEPDLREGRGEGVFTAYQTKDTKKKKKKKKKEEIMRKGMK
jgi:hypothetical protein